MDGVILQKKEREIFVSEIEGSKEHKKRRRGQEMKVNWGALGIAVGLILVAISILAAGLMAAERISELADKLTTLKTLEDQIPGTKAAVRRAMIAHTYVLAIADSEGRTVTVEDFERGYALADRLIGKGY